MYSQTQNINIYKHFELISTGQSYSFLLISNVDFHFVLFCFHSDSICVQVCVWRMLCVRTTWIIPYICLLLNYNAT